MKHFKLIGPLTTTEIDIKDDEVLTWSVDCNKYFGDKKDTTMDMERAQRPMQDVNPKVKTYPTKKSDLK